MSWLALLPIIGAGIQLAREINETIRGGQQVSNASAAVDGTVSGCAPGSADKYPEGR